MTLCHNLICKIFKNTLLQNSSGRLLLPAGKYIKHQFHPSLGGGGGGGLILHPPLLFFP